MNLPICLLSVGIGLGYADAGPTHYSTEDFACFRAIVGSSIYTPSDSATTKLIANEMLNEPRFFYVRLDRDILPNVSPETTIADYKKGYKISSINFGLQWQNSSSSFPETSDHLRSPV